MPVIYPPASGVAGGGNVSSSDVTTIVKLTQAAYDALTPDPATLYIISG